MGGYMQEVDQLESFRALLIKTDTFGITKSGVVKGNVFYDINLDCTSDNSEIKSGKLECNS